jgi:hypothetical protein
MGVLTLRWFYPVLMSLVTPFHLTVPTETHLTNYLFDGARADLTKGLSMNPAFQVTHSFSLASQSQPPSYNFGAVYADAKVRMCGGGCRWTKVADVRRGARLFTRADLPARWCGSHRSGHCASKPGVERYRHHQDASAGECAGTRLLAWSFV